jgi:uncharacterized membrane protein
MIKKIIGYFLKGLLYVTPVAITFYVIFEIIVIVGSLFNFLGFEIHPLIDPILGFISVLILIIAAGMLGSSIILRPYFVLFEKTLESAPLIKIIYSGIKDLLSAFVGSKKRFNQPVLVKMNKESNVEKLGFITKEDLSELGIGPDKVAVYLPHSYAFSGNLFIVSKENVSPINATSAETMKFIVSGGIME